MTSTHAHDPLHGVTLAVILNRLVAHYGWEELAANDVYVNKAFSSYPPASTFKVVLAAAALEQGIGPRPEGP